jgi:hypothetical protein
MFCVSLLRPRLLVIAALWITATSIAQQEEFQRSRQRPRTLTADMVESMIVEMQTSNPDLFKESE